MNLHDGTFHYSSINRKIEKTALESKYRPRPSSLAICARSLGAWKIECTLLKTKSGLVHPDVINSQGHKRESRLHYGFFSTVASSCFVWIDGIDRASLDPHQSLSQLGVTCLRRTANNDQGNLRIVSLLNRSHWLETERTRDTIIGAMTMFWLENVFAEEQTSGLATIVELAQTTLVSVSARRRQERSTSASLFSSPLARWM